MVVNKTTFAWALKEERTGGEILLHLVPTEPVDHELVGYRCWCHPIEYNMQGVDMILHTPSIAREVVPNHLPDHL
tara:strand:+ start:260 stop:484 length:225 start_codon:yes stop_codon:yes gene_type:complete